VPELRSFRIRHDLKVSPHCLSNNRFSSLSVAGRQPISTFRDFKTLADQTVVVELVREISWLPAFPDLKTAPSM